MSQKALLQDLMRGTGVKLTADEASETFGIKNLRARMTELRKAGLKVNTEKVSGNVVRYSIPARDAKGSRAKIEL